MMNSQRATLDLLRAAAGEVERMHQVNNDEAFYDFLPEKPFGFHTQNQQHSLPHQKRLQIAQVINKKLQIFILFLLFIYY